MRKTLSLICLLGSLTVFAQNEINLPKSDNGDSVLSFMVIEQLPIISGCEDYKNEEQKAQRACLQKGVIQFIAKNFKFPKSAQSLGVGAKIYVYFVIEKDGSVSNLEVVSGAKKAYADADQKELKAATELDEATIEAVRKLRFEEPALIRGKPVRMSFTLPINASVAKKK